MQRPPKGQSNRFSCEMRGRAHSPHEGNAFNTISIIGAGVGHRAGHGRAPRRARGLLQAHEPEVADAINRDHLSPVYLSARARSGHRAVTDPALAAGRRGAAGDAGPAPAPLARTIRARVAPGTPAVICAKGIEQDTGALLSGTGRRIAVRAGRDPVGPTFPPRSRANADAVTRWPRPIRRSAAFALGGVLCLHHLRHVGRVGRGKNVGDRLRHRRGRGQATTRGPR